MPSCNDVAHNFRSGIEPLYNILNVLSRSVAVGYLPKPFLMQGYFHTYFDVFHTFTSG